MEPVLAYIDAGSGSLIIQVVIASALALPFFLRTQIRRGWDTLRGKRAAAESATLSSEPPAPDSRPGEPAA